MVISSHNPEKLTREIMGVLDAIPGAASQAFEQAGKQAGKKAVQKLKKTAPKKNKNRGGQWKVSKDSGGGYVVHSKYPWLPHLLTNPRKVVAHGVQHGSITVKSYVSPAEKEAVEEFQKIFEEEIDKRLGELAR